MPRILSECSSTTNPRPSANQMDKIGLPISLAIRIKSNCARFSCWKSMVWEISGRSIRYLRTSAELSSTWRIQSPRFQTSISKFAPNSFQCLRHSASKIWMTFISTLKLTSVLRVHYWCRFPRFANMLIMRESAIRAFISCVLLIHRIFWSCRWKKWLKYNSTATTKSWNATNLTRRDHGPNSYRRSKCTRCSSATLKTKYTATRHSSSPFLRKGLMSWRKRVRWFLVLMFLRHRGTLNTKMTIVL